MSGGSEFQRRGAERLRLRGEVMDGLEDVQRDFEVDSEFDWKLVEKLLYAGDVVK